jgi:8-amino-7-oxononanoate synthase
MPDFASALYLGMRHPSAQLGSWDALTLGRPAALAEPPGAGRLAAGLADLCGCEAASLLPSTLHLYHDLFGLLTERPAQILVDAGSYPIARWGAERSAATGPPLLTFAHADAGAARVLVRRARANGHCPVILADGYYPGAGQAPPLAAYARLAWEAGGYLVIDDTQALGLLGAGPTRLSPYGVGGGGSLRLHGLRGPHLVLGSSLAKAFGAPLAALCGSAAVVRRFEALSRGRVHTSPPSVAAIRAGLNALDQNREHGAQLRWRLARRLAQWRGGAARAGIGLLGGQFPVQTLALGAAIDGEALHACLGQAGIDTVLQWTGRQATVSFIITALHTAREIEHTLAVLAACLKGQARQPRLTRREHGIRI